MLLHHVTSPCQTKYCRRICAQIYDCNTAADSGFGYTDKKKQCKWHKTLSWRNNINFSSSVPAWNSFFFFFLTILEKICWDNPQKPCNKVQQHCRRGENLSTCLIFQGYSAHKRCPSSHLGVLITRHFVIPCFYPFNVSSTEVVITYLLDPAILLVLCFVQIWE